MKIPTEPPEDDISDEEVERLVERLKTVKERVEYILKNYPDTRNNDLYLWLIYVRLFDKELSKYIRFIPYDVLEKAQSFETLRRCRQKLQEEGKYLPTDPKVARRRRRLAKVFKKAIKDV